MTGRAAVDAQTWDERYRRARQWSAEPNALAAELIEGLPPGRALDVAAGEGRMALWLTARGWQVTAMDFSAAGLDRGRTAAPAGSAVDWVVADVTTTDLGHQERDLVLVLYLHLPRPVLTDVLIRAAASVGPGGRLLLLGHDRDNLTEGVGGPQDGSVLWDADLLRVAATGLEIDRLGQHRRGTDAGEAIDSVLWARRPWTPMQRLLPAT